MKHKVTFAILQKLLDALEDFHEERRKIRDDCEDCVRAPTRQSAGGWGW
jgi:hypothetical protein